MMSPTPTSEQPAEKIEWTLDPDAALELGSPEAARHRGRKLSRRRIPDQDSTLAAFSGHIR